MKMEANKENRSQKKEPENVFTVHLMHLDIFVFSVFFFLIISALTVLLFNYG